MNPDPSVVSDEDNVLQDLVRHVCEIESASYFSNRIGATRTEMRQLVSNFQKALLEHLRIAPRGVEWKMEYRPNAEMLDSIDIFGKSKTHFIAIEIDAYRADQAAKKFVSRMALLPPDKPIYLLSLCNPGTERMTKPECIKYFNYCKTLALRLGNHCAGLIIQ